MPTAWFIAPYKPHPATKAIRYCAMDDFTRLIKQDGGDWTESEIRGNRALVKVRANAGTLATIAGAPGFTRLPLTNLVDKLTMQHRADFIQHALDAGYTAAHASQMTSLPAPTLFDALNMLAHHRIKPRYEKASDSIIFDGPPQSCWSILEVDQAIP